MAASADRRGMQFPRGETLAARCAGARGNATRLRSTRCGDRRSHVLQQGGLVRWPFLCGRGLRVQLRPKLPLPRPGNARRRLMAASCALLSAGAARSQEANVAPPDSGLLEDWSVDSALAYYHEDGRIQAIEPVVDVSKVYADGESLNFNATFDALSGASPNGALTSHSPTDVCIAFREGLPRVHNRSRPIARRSALPRRSHRGGR